MNYIKKESILYNMERHFFTTGHDCYNKCQYCFEIFNTNKFSEISCRDVENFNLNNCIIYLSCDTEFLFLDKRAIAFFDEYVLKSKNFNVFSFSTKNNIDESNLSCIKDINDKLKERNIGEIKISISLSNKHKINEIEEGTATYKERLSSAKKLLQNGIKTTVLIKPVLPFIEIEEYQEIVNDFMSIGIRHFVTGSLYFKEDTPFFEKYIKGKDYNITTKEIHWIGNKPIWSQIYSSDTINKLSEYISSLNGFHYNSDKELICDIFK